MSAVLTTLIVAGNASAAIMPASAAAGLAPVAQFVGIYCFSVHSFQLSIYLLRRTPPVPGVTGGNTACAKGSDALAHDRLTMALTPGFHRVYTYPVRIW